MGLEPVLQRGINPDMPMTSNSHTPNRAKDGPTRPTGWVLQAKLAMRAKPNELQCLSVWLSINQHQVGLDVAISMVVPVASQRMVAVPGLQGLIACEGLKNRPQVSVKRCAMQPSGFSLVVTSELPG